jgi:ABC-type multidrug transport system ATPase subunit
MGLYHLSYKEREAIIKERVLQVLDMVELVWCKERIIPERPSTRGNIGGELRRLSIAVEFINLPSVFLLADPTQDLELVMATKLIECLIKFTEKGHTIITSLPKPANQIFQHLDQIVLLSQGCSIFAGKIDDIPAYFCSTPLVYALRKGVEYSDFLLDIAEGVERPVGSRHSLTTNQLQEYFEESQFFINPAVFQESQSSTMLPVGDASYWNISFSLQRDFHLFKIMASRALLVKFREVEVLKKSFVASIFLGLFFGYFLWDLADIEYCLDLVGIPYDDVTVIGSCLLLFISVLFALQVLNVHIICQKISVFRYERAAKCGSTFGFWLTLLCTEIPFTLFFGGIFSNLSYFMSNMNTGIENYIFYEIIHGLICIIGLTSTVMFATIIKREIVVRDLFLFCLFMNVLTSGFLFQQPDMQDAIVNLSEINPFRWAYQGVMVWKFKNLPDGEEYLKAYNFENFNKDKAPQILFYFILFDLILIFFGLLPGPNLLTRQSPKKNKFSSYGNNKSSSQDREEGGGGDGDLETVRTTNNSRHSELVKPAVFSRESSVTGRTIINSQPSTTGADGNENLSGPTVFFHEISLRVADRRSPVGYRRVLHKITGRFDWGKLSAIMGAEGSGKTSLLHILAGQHMGTSSAMAGTVYYNTKPIDLSILPWQRCAFIEAVDEHFRDLTVQDVITYAMQLRCVDKTVIKSVKLNVTRTLELLQLQE